jgi:Tol biopolymer transport system component
MSRPKILSLAATTLMLLGLLAGCAGRAVGTGGKQAEQPDDVGGKSGPLRDADGKIAFESVLHGNGDVYAIKADGTGTIRLTDGPAMEGDPSWSPDGKKIAFVSNRNGDWAVYTTNADGTDVDRLTDLPGDEWFPAWSPDGRKIAFASSRGRDEDIYTMNSDGTGVARLTDLPGMVGSPTWQPVD